MSFGGSYWCRPTPSHEHRSTEVIENRSTSSPRHRSTTPTESTASCNAVRIMTHEEFAAKHPHPRSPVYIKIDQHSDPVIDRHQEITIDRQPPAPIDRQAPIIYRVQMPKIDVVRLNALRPKPKPSENPPEAIKTPSEDETDSMEVDRVPTGRTLKRRKEKVVKHLKRGANEKETKIKKPQTTPRRINAPRIIAACHYGAEYETEYSASIETHTATSIDSAQQKSTDGADKDSVDIKKPQTTPRRINDLGIIAACHCGAEYETEYSASIETQTATLIDSAQQKLTDRTEEESVDSNQGEGEWENDYYNPTMAAHNMHMEEYDEDYEKERAIEQRATFDEEDRLLHHSSWKKNWADDHHHESYAVETAYRDQEADELHEGFTHEELLNMQRCDETYQKRAEDAWKRTHFRHPIDRAIPPSININPSTSIDINHTTSIDIRPKPEITVRERDKFDNQYLTPDEFGIFRDPDGYTKAIDGRTLHVSREDIADILQTANGADNLFMQQRTIPEHYQEATDDPRRINDLGIIAACHCGAEYETEYSASIETQTATLIDSAQQKLTDRTEEESVDSNQGEGEWENDYYNPTMAAHNMHTEEYDEDYEKERAIEQRATFDEEDRLLHHSSWKKNWADDHHHESYAVETAYRDQEADELHEGFTYEELLNMQRCDETDQKRAEDAWKRTHFRLPIDRAIPPSIDINPSTSIDINHTTSIAIRPKPEITVRERDKFDNQYLTPDEFGIFRDPDGYTKAIDGRTLHVSREDIADILQTANGADNLFMQQRTIPEH
ncbi:hypothetical protein F2Q70_00012077 [Brassica cretica]|uniref:Uncharacterized protein n=1 Tax=Brassica cretica TaxID=69181 RepID=A0A8S9M395_BRACR|nr:hypothetical protein F2Q70_00012077 [Brassica cretica]